MSMQVDFQYPRQVEDVASVKAAVANFDKEMRKMMLLMKSIGNTLEGVSTSFSALTCLNLHDDNNVRLYVDSFHEQIIKMKEGAPYQDYNRLVHEEVLAPVNELKRSIKEAEAAIRKRDTSYKDYLQAKKKVDKTERTHAAKSKVLENSKSYPKQKAAREKKLTAFQKQDEGFQECFRTFLRKVETVTQCSMRRYLQLNGAYMASVVDALTSTDPSIEEHVRLYVRQLGAERSTEIAQRKREAENHFRESTVSHRPVGDEVSDSGRHVLHEDTPTIAKAVAAVPAADKPFAAHMPTATHYDSSALSSPNMEDSARRIRAELRALGGVTPSSSGPPAAVLQQQQRVGGPSPKAASATRPVGAEGPSPHEAAAPTAEEVDRRLNEVSSRIIPEQTRGHAAYEDGDESYFGSVSLINEGQQLQQRRLRAASLLEEDVDGGPAAGGGPPLPSYRFAPSTVTGASTMQGGYMATQDRAIHEEFSQGLEKPFD